MSAITMPSAGVKPRASLKRDRRWALITSYVFLVMFAIFFLVPRFNRRPVFLVLGAALAVMGIVVVPVAVGVPEITPVVRSRDRRSTPAPA